LNAPIRRCLRLQLAAAAVAARVTEYALSQGKQCPGSVRFKKHDANCKVCYLMLQNVLCKCVEALWLFECFTALSGVQTHGHASR